MTTMAIPATYFDGRTSRGHAAELSVQAGVAIVSGDMQRQCPLSDLRVSERTRHAARKVTFPDGAYLEIGDDKAFRDLLDTTGHRDSMVVRMQQSWRGALAACAITVAVLLLGYLYGLPAIAKIAARMLPQSAERAIGREALRFLDKQMLGPSVLPAAQRDAIAARFALLAPPPNGAPPFHIVFRSSSVGPNAFALPPDRIVVTDEIVALIDDDDGLEGILAHELGHLRGRHLTRQIIQTSAVGAVAGALVGDISSLVAGIPTMMLYLKYSRDAEREADDYAVAMLKANGIAPAALASAFEKLKKAAGEPPPYLSSHPSAEERIERIRNTR
jgi:Zn-dependent protease with chaperone function